MRATCNSWYNRQLSILGKVLVVNVLMGSLFVYKMLCMVNMPQEIKEEANKIIYQFFWGKKRARIAMSTLYNKKEQGGLKLVNIDCKEKALKIMSIFQCEDNHFLRQSMYLSLSPELGNVVWKCNLKAQDVKVLFDIEKYWVQVMLAWSQINYF